MQPDVALNPIYQEIYPFSKIVGRANILIMPALHSAAISTKLMKSFGGAKLIGPLLIGLDLPIEVAPLRSSTSDILNLSLYCCLFFRCYRLQKKLKFISTKLCS